MGGYLPQRRTGGHPQHTHLCQGDRRQQMDQIWYRVTGLKQWQDAEWRSSFPRHSVILNNIVSVGCIPVILDGSQPWQRHGFPSCLACVISIELTDSTGPERCFNWNTGGDGWQLQGGLRRRTRTWYYCLRMGTSVHCHRCSYSF